MTSVDKRIFILEFTKSLLAYIVKPFSSPVTQTELAVRQEGKSNTRRAKGRGRLVNTEFSFCRRVTRAVLTSTLQAF